MTADIGTPPPDTLWLSPSKDTPLKVSLTPPIEGVEFVVALFRDGNAGTIGLALDFKAATTLVHAIGEIASNLEFHREQAQLNNPKENNDDD